jgi:hypothetical protein
MVYFDYPSPTFRILEAISTSRMTKRLGHEESFVKAPSIALLQTTSRTSPLVWVSHA